MDKLSKIFYLLAGLLAFMPHKNLHAEALPAPIVIELFTSQSCSSCPPADALLHEFAARNDIIALGCHVTYWDHLHWRDTLSQEFCTQRQQSYARSRTGGRVYTPEALINGTISIVGSDKRKLERTLSTNSNRLNPIKIAPAPNAENSYRITLPAFMVDTRVRTYAEIIVFGRAHTQSIKSGENRGRTVSYKNPVINIIELDIPADHNLELITALPLSDYSAAGFAVLIHKGNKHGPIIAGGQYKK